MSDDRLRDELERRAQRVTHTSDWSRHDLLPAVLAGVDSRPQRVTASRAPAFAGLAAAVAILLVLVVALPRLALAPPVSHQTSDPADPPTGSPLPGPVLPRVMSAQEFAVGVLTGRLLSSTVLVDGTIGPRPEEAGVQCHVPPEQPCLMGRLAGTDPSVDVMSRWLATDERQPGVPPSDEMWTWWHLPSGPITGTLVLSVDAAGTIEFVGRARLPEPEDGVEGVTWSVAEAEQLDIDSLGRDEIVLVEGWLWTPEGPGVHISIDCASPSATPIPGLPSRYCQPTSSIVSEYRESGGRGNLVPSTDSINVQRGAYQAFGVKTQDSPRVFAIAPRLYGECVQVAPCWEWDVVARLSEPEPTSTPTRSPTVSEIQCAWPPMPPGETHDPAITPLTVRDETGLLEYCGVSDYLLDIPDGENITVTPFDAGVVVGWSCKIAMPLTFREVEDGYEVLAQQAGACTPDHGTIQMHLTKPISAEDVHATLLDAAQSPTPSPVAESVECSPPDFEVRYPAAVVIVDETALIESCEIVHPAPDETDNPDGDLRLVRVSWPGGACDGPRIDFSFTPTSDGYALTMTGVGGLGHPCIAIAVGDRAILLHMRDDVPANLVTWAVTLPPPTTPQPTDAVPPTPPGTSKCGGAPITIIDHTAIVQSCAATQADQEPEGSEPTAVNPNGDLRRLVLMWMTQEPSACGPVEPAFSLSLFAADAESRYVAVTESHEEPGTGCFHVASWRVVELALAEPISAEDVEFAGSLAATTDSATTDVGAFQLSLTQYESDYEADEPIDIEAGLLYDGVGSAELSGSA